MISLPPQLIITAIIGSVLAGVVCSLMGVFVVRMNLSSIGFCMSHAAFAGAALGLVISIDPLLCAIGFSTLIALLLGPISEKARLHSDVIIGVTFSMMIALAFIFLNFVPGSAASGAALRILWGSIFSLTVDNVFMLLLLTFTLTVLIVLFSKEFQAIMFDRKLAEASGINTKPFYFAILFLTGLTVSLSLKLVGGLLVFALIINPASSVYQFFYDIKKIFIVSPIVGAFSCLLGFLLSLAVDFPIGSSIVIVSAVIFGFSIVVSPKRRKGQRLI